MDMIFGILLAGGGFVAAMLSMWVIGRIANHFSAYKDR